MDVSKVMHRRSDGPFHMERQGLAPRQLASRVSSPSRSPNTLSEVTSRPPRPCGGRVQIGLILTHGHRDAGLLQQEYY